MGRKSEGRWLNENSLEERGFSTKKRRSKYAAPWRNFPRYRTINGVEEKRRGGVELGIQPVTHCRRVSRLDAPGGRFYDALGSTVGCLPEKYNYWTLFSSNSEFCSFRSTVVCWFFWPPNEVNRRQKKEETASHPKVHRSIGAGWWVA